MTEDETLLVQSGKPVGVFPTHADAPRVLIANSNLVPHWATWEHFHELDRKGLAMYGQMTAGSWIYIGSQGIVQGTYETFAEMGPPRLRRPGGRQVDFDRRPRRHGRRTAAGGDHGGLQHAGGRMPREPHRQASRRPAMWTRRRSRWTRRLRCSTTPSKSAKPISVALLGNIVDVLEALLERGIRPDALTDQTSAHDPVNGYLPQGWTVEQWDERRESDPKGTTAAAPSARWRSTSSICCASRPWACRYSTTATTCGRSPSDAGVSRAFDIPGFVPEYIRPLFCRGIGPFRWAALSGDPEDIYKTDAKVQRTDSR